NRGVVDVADRQVVGLNLDVFRRRWIKDAGVSTEGAAGSSAADAEPHLFRRGGGGDGKKSGDGEKAQAHDEILRARETILHGESCESERRHLRHRFVARTTGSAVGSTAGPPA